MALTVTTNQTIAAAGNSHIRSRMHILASELGLTPAQIDAHRADIVRKVITVNDLETSLATLFDYDGVTYKAALAALPPEPGKNDAVISYHYLRAALEAFFTGVDDAPTD